MKRILLAVCGSLVIAACGGGGGYNPPASPPTIFVTISPLAQTDIDAGQSVTFAGTVENDSSAKGVTWSASAAGLTGQACGTFTNATTSGATYNAPRSVSANLSITVTATSIADTSKSNSAQVLVSPPPSITTTTLNHATLNSNYSATLQAAGGVAPLTWFVASGALPTGLSLASSGAITGEPTASGNFTFTVQVTDSSTAPEGGPATAQAQLSLTVVTLIDINTASLPAGAEGVAYLQQISATGGTPPYLWSVTVGSLPSGLTLQPTSGAISGNPASLGNFTFTVKATDSSPTPQAATQVLALAIGSPGPLAITTSALLDGTVNTPYNAMMAATGGTPPYRWSIPAGAQPSGMALNATTGTIAGKPASTGTANFTVQVTDSSSTPQTQTQTLSLTVNDAGEACTSSGNNAALNGSYAFSLSGFNDVGFLTVVGSFTADGAGRISAGEADANGVLGAQRGDIIASASAYSVGPDHRGCATLATPFGTLTTHFALRSISSNIATAGRMIEWDSPSSSAYIAAGQLLRQTSSSFANGLSGSYAFRTIGWDPSAQGGREACVGVLSASGNTLSGMEQDCNDAWNIISTAVPTVAGTYTTLDANGRGTGIITLGEANSNIVFYAVSSSQLLVVNADPGPFASGEWDQQSVPVGGAGFTQASLNGNMVFHLNGLSLAGTASAVSLETASADGNSSLAIKFYADRGGTMQVSSTLTCTYAVEPSGRVFLSSDTQSCGSNTPVLYLTGVNAGFIMDAAPGVDTGSIEPQSAGPFNNASLEGNFFGGMDEVVIQSAQTEVDPVAVDGTGNINGTADISSMTSQDAGASFPSAIYSVNFDGTFSVSSSGGAVAGVIVSNTKFVMFSPSTLATPLPTLLVMQK